MPLYNFRTDMEKIKASMGKSFSGISTGIETLDGLISGFRDGDLDIIAGRPGLGKSSLARDVLINVGKNESPYNHGMLFTMEMKCYEIADLIVATTAQVNLQEIQRGLASTKDRQKFENQVSTVAEYNISIQDDSFITPDSIRTDIIKTMEYKPVSIVIIDYLQLMSLRKPVESRQLEVAEISRELKAIAMEFNIPVVALSQLNRNVEYRESARPRLVDLRESGAMEQDSSKVILIHRQSYYNKQLDSNAEDDGEAELIVAKNRGGFTGTVECGFIAEWTSFRNKPKEY